MYKKNCSENHLSLLGLSSPSLLCKSTSTRCNELFVIHEHMMPKRSTVSHLLSLPKAKIACLSIFVNSMVSSLSPTKRATTLLL